MLDHITVILLVCRVLQWTWVRARRLQNRSMPQWCQTMRTSTRCCGFWQHGVWCRRSTSAVEQWQLMSTTTTALQRPFILTSPRQSDGNFLPYLFTSWLIYFFQNAPVLFLRRVGPGYPLSAFAPPLPIHFLIFCSLLLFPFFLFSFTLLIFFYCPSDPFLPESPHSVSRREVVGGDRTWV